MHILVVNVFFAPHSYGGATIVAEEVAKRLVTQHGQQVTVISAMTRPELAPYTIMKVARDGITNYLINLPESRSYAEIYANMQVAERVNEIVSILRPDVAHVHCVQELGASVIPTLKRAGIPVILSVHDFWWLCERQFMIRPDGRYCGQDPIRVEDCRGCVDDLSRARFRMQYLAEQAALCDLITYPSKFARDLSVRSGMPEDTAVHWENGVKQPDSSFFEKQRRRREKDSRVSFGFVGGPSRIKGWPIIRGAFERIGRDDFCGYLVDGSLDGTWYAKQKIEVMKGEWIVHPRYSMDTMDDFYSKIDVLLFLSQWKETFGLTVREALSRGIRVIQTDSGGTVEHNGVKDVELLQIGDGPAKLMGAVNRCLDRADVRAEPLPVTSFDTQTTALMAHVRRVVPDPGEAVSLDLPGRGRRMA